LIVALRVLPYRWGWRRPARLPAPVVVVGNITVGGTGKTPLVIHLAQRLAAEGERPGILCRGYGGRSTHWPCRIAPDSDPREVGDEPVMIARRSGLPVAAGPDRVAAGRLLLTQGCTVLLCDDGLQHQALARDFEIAVVDGARGLGNGFRLPAGPLRESAQRLKRVDALVIHGKGFTTERSAYALDLGLGDTVTPLKGDEARSLADFVGRRVHAVAGIGHPQRFFSALRQAGLEVVEHPFPDHYDYRAEDFRAIDGVLLMTEKDAVKCAHFSLPDAWYVPVHVRVDPRLEADVLVRVRQRGKTGTAEQEQRRDHDHG